jgi:hypothetical protein
LAKFLKEDTKCNTQRNYKEELEAFYGKEIILADRYRDLPGLLLAIY